jgi:hypothetical protein
LFALCLQYIVALNNKQGIKTNLACLSGTLLQ